jgi:hypothetical protein
MSASVPASGPNPQYGAAVRTPVEFVAAQEPFSRYVFADGVEFRMKMVLTNVWRVEGQSTPDGKPAYEFSWHPVMCVDSPRQKEK